MSWTYSENPAASEKDAIRYLVGDTKSDNPLTSDEEIAWALSQNNNNIFAAAAWVAKSIASYFATLAESTEIGPIKIQYGRRAEAYRAIAADLESKTSTQFTALEVYGGGISKEDKATLPDDNATELRKNITDFYGTSCPINDLTEG